jgi:hypothetical protein
MLELLELLIFVWKSAPELKAYITEDYNGFCPPDC